jgi:hypothetical protein
VSVTSLLPGLPPSYGPYSGNNSQSAKLTALAKLLQEKAPTRADGSRATSIQVEPAVKKDGKGMARVEYADPADVSHLQSALAQALRANEATAGRATGGTTGSDGSRSSSGTALYELVSQMGNSDPSTAALLRSWNSIMQTGQVAEDTGAAALQGWSQIEAPAFESGSLNLTA